ncbi:restriction endonuclease subunit S [Tenacibaculum maritimum]|uniref:restriction endonuclease subunit S n=1 Tax=Tenacibaculum maritimum TaxID=107401 RepID=UPI001E28D667|nr:restriction endonuclease subunit S [Tenacibaculum maritimum]MCD9580713.1 restriction endonuclease subunit S [Tenacibaculum maritimum]MCD9634796.1 restriction endonuclease subunit S [Tenacibaculum maritimum]
MELTTKQGFKQTEVGLIPEDWRYSNFGELISNLCYGPRFSSKDYSKTGNVKTIRGTDINLLGDILYEQVPVAQLPKALVKEHMLVDGDLVMITTADCGLTGVYFDDGFPYISSAYAVRITLNSQASPLFFKYLFQTKLAKEQIELYIRKGTVGNLPSSDIYKFKFPLPPTLKEQKAIATALSDVDDLIVSLEDLIAKKQAIKQGAMQQLLTPPHKGGKRLPGFSGDWVEKNLGELGQFKNGVNKGAEDFGHGKPFINLLDVFGIPSISSDKSLGLINSTPEERKIYDLKKGDVLFVRSSVKPSGVGLTTVIIDDLINSVFSGFLIRFRDNNTLNLTFKIHCFHSKEFRDKVISSSSSSANTNINQEALSSLTIWYPPTDSEQKGIAKILSDMDTELEQLETKKAKYQQLKQGMLQELLTGNTRLV